MILIAGGVQALVRIDMTMPGKPEPEKGVEVSPWEREAYGEGGRFGSMTSIPSGDPMKDRITVSFTGCAYYAAKKLAEEGHEVAFISLVGDDPLGLAAIEDLKRSGVDTSGMIVLKSLDQDDNEDEGEAKVRTRSIPGHLQGSITSVRVVARNFLGDVEFWRVDERILKEFTSERIGESLEKTGMIGHSSGKACFAFADGNLPEEGLITFGKFCKDNDIKLYFDPSSPEGAQRGAKATEYFAGIMPGRREAELMSGMEILSADQMSEAAKHFEEKGVEKTFITIKGGGLYYREGEEDGIMKPERVIRFGETTGAGDALTSGILIAFAQGRSLKEAAEEGMKAASGFLADVSDERRY